MSANGMIKNVKFGGSSLQLKKWDMSMIADHAAIAMIAKRGSGKSWVCRDIMYHKRRIPGGTIISPTDKMSSFYGDFFPQLYIHYNYDSAILQKALYRQGVMIEKEKEKKKLGKKFDPSAFLIMDDCMSKKATWSKDENIAEIFMNGRHYKITYILTMQYSLGISPEMRSNFDYIFILGEDFISNQKRIYEHYAGMFPTFDSFQTAFNTCTDDFGCMVINNKIKSKRIEEKVFWYKAEEHGDFEMGCKQFRDFHAANFDPAYDRRKPIFDINTLLANKRGKAHINVEKV
jgi:hypothetical protein